MTHYHPKLDDKGNKIAIRNPSKASALNCWSDAAEAATVVPGGPMPADLNGVAFNRWQPPHTDAGWASIPGQADFDEPPFTPPTGKNPAAGAVIEESDGRVWLVSPTNGHGGYSTTFPKGRVEAGASLQATAIREAFEESGLQVQLTGHFADSNRDTTFTRLYRARRIAGNPADCSWESQAVHLVPRARLAGLLTHPNDKPLADALCESPVAPRREELLKSWTLDSATRIVATINSYRSRFGKWPSTLLVHADTADAIQKFVLSPLAWQMLNAKVKLVSIEEGTIIAEGSEGRVEYEGGYQAPTDGPRADVWIWGINLAD